MNETQIARICLAVTIIGMLLFAATYQEEFTKKTINEVLAKEGNKGILYGKIDYVVKSYPVTIFILNDGNKATVYYPKATTLQKNDFVEVYAQSQLTENKLTIFAQKVNNK